MPKGFVDLYKHYLTNPLTIHCENECLYEVWFQETGKEIWLEEDWEFMVNDIEIKRDSHMFFNYLGNSEFTMKVIEEVGINLEYTRCPKTTSTISKRCGYMDSSHNTLYVGV